MVLVPKHAVKANGRCLHHGILVPKTHGEGLAAANKSRNALGLPPQAMALALAKGRKPMPPTRPIKASCDPCFSIGPRETWFGGLPGNAHVLRPFPMLWRVLGHSRATPGRHVASIMSTRRARSGPSGAGRRKPMFWKVGRGTGRPQISAHARNDADDAHWKASKVAPAMLATEAAGGGTKQDGAHARTHAHAESSLTFPLEGHTPVFFSAAACPAG